MIERVSIVGQVLVVCLAGALFLATSTDGLANDRKQHGQSVSDTAQSAPEQSGEDPLRWWPIPIISRVPPMSDAAAFNRFDYVPSTPAAPYRRLCVAVPRANFDVVAATIQGVEIEARRHRATVTIHDAGGEDIARQREQIASCIGSSDAILLMPVAGTGRGCH